MPAAARKGDRGVTHCSGYVIAVGSENVFINNRPAARVGDTSTVHLRPGNPCRGHVAPIAQGSRTVFINGIPSARVGDPLASCTSVAQGSDNVFAA
jgi:uncharacterized Zn-binding protein involved in type VI secretion